MKNGISYTMSLAACGGTFSTGLTGPPWRDFHTIYLNSHKISWIGPCTPALQSQPALVRQDVDMQLFSLIMNASLSITASCHARSGPGVWARD